MSKEEKNKLVIIFAAVIVTLGMILVLLDGIGKRGYSPRKDNKPIIIDNNEDFTTKLIRSINVSTNSTNYLISPYNIETALNMLREGAAGNTKIEIDNLLGNEIINNISIPSKLNVANGVFIKEDYKNDVKKDFISILDNKYQAEILYDEFTTPDVINNWVKEKTNNMIDKLLDEMNKDFVLGLASALALDVEWTSSFECASTSSEEFNKIENSKINVEMMHQSYTAYAKYLKNDDVEGIVLPYNTNSDNVDLEFIALLPNNVNTYVNSITKEKIDNLFNKETLATDKYHINLSLPRFTYDYEIEDFIKVLQDLGIKEAFDPDKANFKKIIEIDENIYVGEAIHKTKIELNEKGTKAAAVTYFGMFKNSAMLEKDYEEVDIKFNRPFVYMIRERNTGEILFFGTVYEPNIWNGSTCSENNLSNKIMNP